MTDPQREPDLDDVDPFEIENLRDLCAEIALEAGEYARSARASIGTGRRVAHETKSSAIDPVTEFDRDTERLVVERITAARPDDGIVGEEGANRSGTTGYDWHVDPIDGTVNFVYDHPMWCTSIAVARNGRTVAAAIHAPMLAERYTAAIGRGARVEMIGRGGEGTGPSQHLSVSNATELSTALIATGFSYKIERRAAEAATAARLMPLVRDLRRSGSAALDLAFVAAGRLDGYYEEILGSWDLAAGSLLVAEAGGRITCFNGGDLHVTDSIGVTAAAPGLHAALMAVVHDHSSG